jgi:predicted transcriptional regulator
MSADHRKQNFETIIKYCYKERKVEDIAKKLNLTKTTIRKYCNILIAANIIGYNKIKIGQFNKKTRSYFTVNFNYSSETMTDMCNIITEQNKKANDKYLTTRQLGEDYMEPTTPYARVIKERHVPRDKKASPRVYIGSSFQLAGW